ncbi:hypothetical protein ACN2XU_23090 [Primorskyibacter sp. 2E107]|uniref:hypothetical protein n=1 Tax=Primorskyibacter sp. 2E107 TaxID=3403458 RepID=UPI003AF9E00E
MRRVFFPFAVGFSLVASFAHADMPTQGQLHMIQLYAPQADLSSLSRKQTNMILSVIHSGRTEGRKNAMVKTFLRKYDIDPRGDRS